MCNKVHNYMSVRRSTITDLSEYVKSVMRAGTPHKGKKWPTIAQLPGDIKDPDQPRFKPNLVAYQVCQDIQVMVNNLVCICLILMHTKSYIVISYLFPLPPSPPPPPIQITTYLPFEVDMVFEIGMFSATLSVGGERFTSELASRVERFDRRFEDTFQLKAKVVDYVIAVKIDVHLCPIYCFF